MSRRQRATPEEHTASEAGPAEARAPPPETRRTRSGRTVRAPAALASSEAPARTPGRRSRRPVLQELPAVEEKKNTEEPERTPESEAGQKEPEPEPADRALGTGALPLPGTGPGETETETAPRKKPRLGPGGTMSPAVPLGKPKSGRVWKDRNKQRFSALVRDKPLCSSWEKKMQAKREKELVKQYSSQLKEEKAKQKEEKRKRREDNLKRRAENERKAEIVQVIRNTAKIKRMKKKQLRKIEKRDTLALLQKSQKQIGKAKGQKNTTADEDLT